MRRLSRYADFGFLDLEVVIQTDACFSFKLYWGILSLCFRLLPKWISNYNRLLGTVRGVVAQVKEVGCCFNTKKQVIYALSGGPALCYRELDE